jgi:hypothetical protein
MMGKTDINRDEGEEFFSIFPVDTYRRLCNNNVYYFSNFNLSYFKTKMITTL